MTSNKSNGEIARIAALHNSISVIGTTMSGVQETLSNILTRLTVLEALISGTPVIQFALTESTGEEGTTPASIAVELSRAGENDVTVEFLISGTAIGGTDYTVPDPASLTIAAGQSSGTIDIEILNDIIPENAKTIILTLQNPVNAILGTNAIHTYTITDTDTNEITFNTTGATFAPVLVLKDGETTNVLWTFDDDTTSESLTPSKDYGSSGTYVNRLECSNWAAIRRINLGYDQGDGGDADIELVDNNYVTSITNLAHVADTLEDLCLSHSPLTSLNIDNFILLERVECYYCTSLTTISKANTPALRRLCLEGNNITGVLDLSSNTLFEDLRLSGNNVTQVVMPTSMNYMWHWCAMGNPLTTPYDFSLMTHVNQLWISGATINGPLVLASDNLGSMWLNSCGLTDLDISGCTVSNGLYITATGNTGLSQAVIEELLAFLDGEGITGGELNITNTVTPNAASLVYIASLQGKGWTISYDEEEITVQFSSTSSSGAEDSTPATIAVVLSGAMSDDVTVAFTLGGTAVAGEDYTAPDPLTVTISAGDTSANIEIPITNDTDEESSETIIITLTEVTAGDAVLGTNTVHTYTITDDDESSSVEGLVAYYPCNEGTGTVIYDNYNDYDLSRSDDIVWAAGHGDNTYAFDPYTTTEKRVSSAAFSGIFSDGLLSMCWWVYSPAQALGAILSTVGAAGFHITKDSAIHQINGGNYPSSSGATTGEWHHIAIVLDMENMTYQWYFDGVADGNGTHALSSFSGLSGIYLGGYDGTNYRYRGYINDVYLFNTAIDQATVQACMNNTLL